MPRGEKIIEIRSHLDEAEPAHPLLGWALLLRARDCHVNQTAGLMAARIRSRPRHPRRVRTTSNISDLDVMRPVAVPEDEDLALRAQHVRGCRETRSKRFVHKAAGIGRMPGAARVELSGVA